MAFVTIVSITNIEVNMEKDSKKCICGREAALTYLTEIGRIKDALIEVTNVPIYVCSCGESFTTGSDSIKFAKIVEIGINNNLKQIDFDNYSDFKMFM